MKKIIIGIIITIIGGFLPYFIIGTSIDNNDDSAFANFVFELAIKEYANDLIKDSKEMAITNEAIDYIDSKEFKEELINKIEYELKFGDDYTVVYGVMCKLEDVLIKLCIISGIVSLIIYLGFIKFLGE